MPSRLFSLLAVILLVSATHAADTPRQTIAKAVVMEDADEQAKLVSSLAGKSDPVIRDLLTAWKEGGIYIFEAPAGLPGFTEGQGIALTLAGDKDADDKQGAIRVDSGEPLKDAEGNPVRVVTGIDVESADTSSTLRLAMKGVLDLFALAAPNPKARINAVSTLGLAQDPSQLEALRSRQKVETDASVQRALREAIAQIEIKNEDPAIQIAAAKELGRLGSIPSQDLLKQAQRENSQEKPEVAKAAGDALAAIASHVKLVNFYGTIFRGFSLGSILLVVAIGLAITFGLMGVINMAHGELIVVGAYTTYIVQNVFGTGLALSPFGLKLWFPGINVGGLLYESYFLVAIPLSFLTAALVGIALERGIIRFLYRRPLESLLATWGVSLVLQQLFRLVFGANNVQVYSPSWLSGNWTFHDIIFGWNRVFVIGFAVVIIVGTWAILNKTPLGLLIRAVMQNRGMAACMGVRTERVNMLTFGFGSGLAGLAGAFLSQIGNVGPGLGQDYIVNAFMTVVVGGVGSLAGTVISALGIGVVDQSLQQILLNPVLGKILVLVGIIFFLQWRPAGLFVTKSRSLES